MKRFNVAKALQNEEAFYKPLEKAVIYVLYEIIYKPIFEIIKEEITDEWIGLELPKVLKERKKQEKNSLRAELKRNKEEYSYLYHNSKENTLIKAILTGRVQYVYDHFEGAFNSSISREIKKIGGVWDWKRKQWRLELAKLPADVSLAIGTASGKVNRVKSQINEHLKQVENLMKQDPQFTFEQIFSEVIRKMEHKFADGIEGIIIVPEFTPEMLKALSEKYAYNMNLYIKKWTDTSIVRLRGRVIVNTFNGNRAENIVKELEHDFSISYNKAKFLARQETSLLMSQFREERFKSAGVNKYRWSTSGDGRVRPYHKRLNGKIFTWDNPPVVDEMGHRAHPGQDFNCRCVAIPIVE